MGTCSSCRRGRLRRFTASSSRFGAAFDSALVSREALDVCALENWHFSMRTLRETALASPLTPIELQLQWRVVYARDFVGATALRGAP